MPNFYVHFYSTFMLFDIIYKIYCLTRWENISDPKSTEQVRSLLAQLPLCSEGPRRHRRQTRGRKFQPGQVRGKCGRLFFVLLLSSLPPFWVVLLLVRRDSFTAILRAFNFSTLNKQAIKLSSNGCLNCDLLVLGSSGVARRAALIRGMCDIFQVCCFFLGKPYLSNRVRIKSYKQEPSAIITCDG